MALGSLTMLRMAQGRLVGKKRRKFYERTVRRGRGSMVMMMIGECDSIDQKDQDKVSNEGSGACLYDARISARTTRCMSGRQLATFPWFPNSPACSAVRLSPQSISTLNAVACRLEQAGRSSDTSK